MKKYKIALVDDDPVILMMIQLTLESYDNVEVETFDSGEEFFQLIDIVKPDIVITDYYMDTINKDAMRGSDLIVKLHDKGISIPTIILSSQDNMKLAIELSKFEVADYIEKSDDYSKRIGESVQSIISMGIVNEKLDSVESVIKKDYNHIMRISLLTVIGLLVIGLVFF